MRYLKKLFNFYIFGNLHVALASFSLTKLSLLTQQNSANTIPLFVFFATVLSYNYIRLMRIKTIKSGYYNWISHWRVYLILLSVLTSIACAFLIVQIRWQALLSLIPFALLTGFYVLPPVISKKMNLRTLPGFKIFLIAFTWAGITVLFPLAQYGMENKPIFWLFFQRFLFVFVLTLPFDIRDVTYDSATLKTLPVWLGIKNVKVLGLIVLGLFLFVEIAILKPANQEVEIFIALCLGVLLLRSSTKKSQYYYAFWVEGIPIFWLVLYYMFA